MSLRDLVENDCGGSNSLVKLSTHFVQDHAFKDKDLRQSTQDGRNDQSFSQTSVEEVKEISLLHKHQNILSVPSFFFV